MTPNRLDHVVFSVRDLGAAANTWRDVLGLEVGERLDPESIQSSIGLMFLGEGSAFLELAQPQRDQGPVADALEARGEGMLSISIEVDDVGACVSELQGAGIAIANVVDGPLPGTRVARIEPQAAHGVRLQLIQRV